MIYLKWIVGCNLMSVGRFLFFSEYYGNYNLLVFFSVVLEGILRIKYLERLNYFFIFKCIYFFWFGLKFFGRYCCEFSLLV